jgi:hypothetical protein
VLHAVFVISQLFVAKPKWCRNTLLNLLSHFDMSNAWRSSRPVFINLVFVNLEFINLEVINLEVINLEVINLEVINLEVINLVLAVNFLLQPLINLLTLGDFFIHNMVPPTFNHQ